jgi:hypothetical protein
MSHSIALTEWKGEESTGKHSQGELAYVGEVRTRPVLADYDFISRSSWEGALRFAVQRSGIDDFEVADQMAISHGYMSKVLKGVAGLYGKRLVRFMQITGSVAPLQWMADQVGYELKRKEPESETDRLKRELAEARRELRRMA